MLAGLRRSLALAPTRFSRQFASTPRRYSERNPTQDELDKDLEWEAEQQEKPSEKSSTPEPAPAPAPEPQTSGFSQLLSTTEAPASASSHPENGLSYYGLPEHKIFLDIPPAEDPLIRYLASSFLHAGRRHTAERRAARVLLHLHTLTRAEPLPILRKAIQIVMPNVRITRHTRSTKTIEIPVALTEKQQVHYAMRWILKASEERGGRTVEERFARETLMVHMGKSKALKKKDVLHNTAMVNRGNVPVGRAL